MLIIGQSYVTREGLPAKCLRAYNAGISHVVCEIISGGLKYQYVYPISGRFSGDGGRTHPYDIVAPLMPRTINYNSATLEAL